LGEAAGAAGAAKLWPTLREKELDFPAFMAAGILPTLGNQLGRHVGHIGYKKRIRSGPMVSAEQAEAMRKAVGAKAGVYGLSPKNKALGSAYLRVDPDSLRPLPSESSIAALGKLVHEGTPEIGRNIVDRGGILLEPLKPLKKAAEANEQPPRKSFGRRLAEKVGLGALSLGVAAPIIYASLPEAHKQKVREGLGGAFSKMTGKMTGKLVPAEKFRAAGLYPGSTDYKRVIEIAKNAGVLDLRHEKLASDRHWSAVAAALVA